MTNAQQLIEAHGLQPHPEGGWYRETFRAAAVDGRATSTMIHFLLEAEQHSHWHRVDADELWLWHAGDPLALRITESEDAPPKGGIEPQLIVKTRPHTPAGCK